MILAEDWAIIYPCKLVFLENIDTGLAFQEHAEKSLNTVVEKYFHNVVSGQVTLEKAGLALP